MELRELKGYAVGDLKRKIEDLRGELFNLKLQNIAGSLENTAKVRDLRRTVAKALTVLKEKLKVS